MEQCPTPGVMDAMGVLLPYTLTALASVLTLLGGATAGYGLFKGVRKFITHKLLFVQREPKEKPVQERGEDGKFKSQTDKPSNPVWPWIAAAGVTLAAVALFVATAIGIAVL